MQHIYQNRKVSFQKKIRLKSGADWMSPKIDSAEAEPRPNSEFELATKLHVSKRVFWNSFLFAVYTF